MRHPTITPRRDGTRRMTLKVDHHVGRGELVNLLAREFEVYGIKPVRSAGALVKLVRSALKEYGDAGTYNLREGDGASLEAAEEAVDRVFPELKERSTP